MKLFQLFGKSAKKEPVLEPEREITLEGHGVYSGMRVEVMDTDSHLLFIAKLMDIQKDSAKLHKYLESQVPFEEEPMKIRIRGYSDITKKAIYLEGILKQADDGIWPVEGLTFIKSGNDRAFSRVNTDIDGSMVTGEKAGAEEEPCKLLNISVGGAYIRAEPALELGERFLLKVKLGPDRDTSLIFSEVCRIVEREDEVFEYGCRFVGLDEDDREQILRSLVRDSSLF